MKDLGVVDPDTGFAPCPYARKAFKDSKLKVVKCFSRQDLWEKVSVESKSFDPQYSVIICAEEDPSQTYDEVEAGCIAMNEWFALNKMDVWLLAFQRWNFTMIFVQKLSELDDASQTLEKMGYYESYEPDDYLNLILYRRERRHKDAGC